MLALAASDFLSTPLVLLASIWVGVWSIIRSRRLKKKKTFAGNLSGLLPTPVPPPAPKTAPAPTTMTSSDVRGLAMELQTLLADLADTSRQMAAQMDNRHTRLERLLADADARIAKLESLQSQTPKSPPPIDDHHALDLSCFTSRLTSQVNAISQTARSPAPPSRDILHAPTDPLHRKIYELADKGQSSRDIAIHTGKPPGEIELILGLRRR